MKVYFWITELRQTHSMLNMVTVTAEHNSNSICFTVDGDTGKKLHVGKRIGVDIDLETS